MASSLASRHRLTLTSVPTDSILLSFELRNSQMHHKITARHVKGVTRLVDTELTSVNSLSP